MQQFFQYEQMDSSIASLRLENLKKISHFTWWNDPHKVYTFLEHEVYFYFFLIVLVMYNLIWFSWILIC